MGWCEEEVVLMHVEVVVIAGDLLFVRGAGDGQGIEIVEGRGGQTVVGEEEGDNGLRRKNGEGRS